MLYLIRHSITVQDPGAPSHTWVLSLEGRVRARQLARHLVDRAPLTCVYTSFEAKAVETGEVIASELGIPRRTSDGLHEQERRTVSYFPTMVEYQAAIARLFAHPDELVFGEETASQACTRFSRSVEEINQRHVGDHIAVVTHGTVLSLFVARHNPSLEAFRLWMESTMPDCYVLSRSGFGLEERISIESLAAE